MPYMKNLAWRWYGLKKGNKLLAAKRWYEFPKVIDFHHPIMHTKDYEVVEIYVKECSKTK